MWGPGMTRRQGKSPCCPRPSTPRLLSQHAALTKHPHPHVLVLEDSPVLQSRAVDVSNHACLAYLMVSAHLPWVRKFWRPSAGSSGLGACSPDL